MVPSALRRTLLVGGVWGAVVHRRASACGSSDGALAGLWASALDGHLLSHALADDLPPPADTPVLYLAPVSTSSIHPRVPPAFVNRVVFSLTAWNPMGQEKPLEANQEANRALLLELRQMRPVPTAAWHSYGFNVKEGWREDGFSLAFHPGSAAQRGREYVLSLARQFEQAAIYEYRHLDGRLEREVIWTQTDKQAEHGGQIEYMQPVVQPPDSSLSTPVWLGSR